MATPEWQAWQLASANSVEQLAKNAERLATNVKSTLTLAEQGNTDAQSNLGRMYQRGQGVPQDYETAVKWY